MLMRIGAAASLQDALAQCKANGVNLTVSGKGMSDCVDLLAPFCPNGVIADQTQALPRCAQAGSAAKSAAQLKEALANKQPDALPWLLIGGVVAAGALAWWLLD